MDENQQLLEDVSPPFMMPRLEVAPQLLSSELLPSHNSLVVEMNNSEYLPSVSYATDELLGHELTDEDRNLAAALVAVQLVQQQKHQQLQDHASSPNQNVISNNSSLALASLVAKEETMRTPVINSTYSLHDTEHELRDSDCDTRTETGRIIKKSLPHKKRITRKLKKPVAILKKIHVHRCSGCDQTFNTAEELTSHTHTCHISIVVPINQFACQICSLICNDQLTFFEHLKTHYEPSPPSAVSAFKIQQPEKDDKNKESTLLGSLLSLSPLNCIQCGKTFRRQKTFETHMRDFHAKVEDEFSEPEDLMEGIRCVVDQESAADEDGNDNDSKVWYASGAVTSAEHVCHLCGQVLSSNQEVCDHLNECKATLDPKIEQNSDSELKGRPRKKQRRKSGQLFCPHCDRVFSHRNSLMYHMRGHTGERPHQCDVCGKSFFAASALKVHMRLHSGDKPYKCEFCGRHFRQWGDLKYHCISIHSDQKQYQCEYCGKDFARKYSLIVHRRIHTGEKNYRCEFCGKTFRASSYLQNHRRIHTGEKPHPCEVCGKPFRVRSDMKRHLNTHSRRRGPGPTPSIGRTRTISTAAIKIQDSNSATESIVPDEEIEEENAMVDEGTEDNEEEQPVEEEAGAAQESEDSIHYQRDPLETVRDGTNTLYVMPIIIS